MMAVALTTCLLQMAEVLLKNKSWFVVALFRCGSFVAAAMAEKRVNCCRCTQTVTHICAEQDWACPRTAPRACQGQALPPGAFLARIPGPQDPARPFFPQAAGFFASGRFKL